MCDRQRHHLTAPPKLGQPVGVFIERLLYNLQMLISYGFGVL
ncbi:hypothetical protein [Fischerella thermalis]|nr:hypothetical protein [Fischerella thermalis]